MPQRKAAFTGKPGPDMLYLQVMASLDVTLLTSANRNARDRTYAAAEPSQEPRSRADAVGTLHRLTGSACYPAISWCIRRPVGVPVPRMHAHYATSLDTT